METQVALGVGIGFLGNELHFPGYHDLPVVPQHLLKLTLVGMDVGMISSCKSADTRVVGVNDRFGQRGIFAIRVSSAVAYPRASSMICRSIASFSAKFGFALLGKAVPSSRAAFPQYFYHMRGKGYSQLCICDMVSNEAILVLRRENLQARCSYPFHVASVSASAPSFFVNCGQKTAAGVNVERPAFG